MTDRAALVFHMNLDHSNLNRQQANDLLGRDLEQMLNKVDVPINISSTGRDWELLEEVNPEVLYMICENNNITVLNGPYTHAILGHFPNAIESQLAIGDETHRRIFGESLSPYGFVPEFAYDSSTLPLLNEHWEGHIASEPASYFVEVNYSENCEIRRNRAITKEKGTLRVLSARGEEIILNLAERSNVNRKMNKFFRGLNEPKHVAYSLKKMAQKSDAPFVIYVHDFETPLINKAIYNNNVFRRIDQWDLLMDYLPRSDVNFICLDEDALNESKEHESQSDDVYAMLPREKDKWIKTTQSSDLLHNIYSVESGHDYSDGFETKALLQAMTSDAFVSLGETRVEPLELRGRLYDDKLRKHVEVISSFSEYDPMRYLESAHILDCLKRDASVNEGIDNFPEAQKMYFGLLQKIFSKHTANEIIS